MSIQKQLWLNLAIAAMGLVLAGVFFDIPAIKTSVYLGIMLLILTLVPIHFKKWAIYRRDFGIASGIILTIHGLLAFKSYYSFIPARLFTINSLGGTLATVVLGVLLITSNFAIQRRLKSLWRVIHAFIWFAVPLSLVHAILAGQSFTQQIPLLAVVTLGGLTLFAFVKPLLPGANQKESLRDMGLAVLGILIALGMYFVSPLANTPSPTQPKAGITENAATSASPKQSTGLATVVPAQGSAESQVVIPTKTSVPASNSFTLVDIVKHNTESDCYVAFQGQVYDATSYLPMHPGGAQKAARKCGQALDDFDAMHAGGSFASDAIQVILRPLSIGTVR